VLLTILEKVMALLSITDKSTVARLTDLCHRAKDSVLEVHEKFTTAAAFTVPQVPGEQDAPGDPHKMVLLDVGSRYSSIMISLIQSLMRRQAVMPGAITRHKLGEVTAVLKELTPKLIAVSRGELEFAGCVPKLLGAIDEAAELIKAVPQFSARLDVQFVATDLDMAVARLRDALCSRNVSMVGGAARQMAQQIEDLVKKCQALGLAPSEADAVRQAVARVIIAAKECLTGDYAAGIQKFEAAVRDLEALMRSLPSKSIPTLHEDSFDLLSAARKLITGGLSSLVAELK
jgi:hypothetical protein